MDQWHGVHEIAQVYKGPATKHKIDLSVGLSNIKMASPVDLIRESETVILRSLPSNHSEPRETVVEWIPAGDGFDIEIW